VKVSDERLFERVVRAIFTQRRKMLGNALKSVSPHSAAALARAQIDPRRRPETLQLAELARLTELLAAAERPAVL
jgi:16S rRNA A1518/A1519 N6-dimethyltransferase RsmA/KsgA/DIM1 with predicted DNA glycosylase/AP lyase activity